jgi:4-hydroxy-2-oxoheptanedioate aldolase
MSMKLRQALQAGRRVYGTMVTSRSPLWPPMIKRVGLDFVFIDTEHVSLDRDTVSWMCRAYSALDIAPIVRIPSPCPYAACQMLDGGALGVVAPYVESAEQVRSLVGAVKFRPLKGERLHRMLAGREELEPALREYLSARNANSLCIVNIESGPALKNLDEILAVPGLDVALIGPHDLSCSLGIPEQYDAPRFEQAIREIVGKARAAGVAAGMHMVYGQMEQEVLLAEHGANFILHSGDVFFVERGVRCEINELRSRLGDNEKVAAGDAPAI